MKHRETCLNIVVADFNFNNAYRYVKHPGLIIGVIGVIAIVVDTTCEQFWKMVFEHLWYIWICL